jgi:hypothetical protein
MDPERDTLSLSLVNAGQTRLSAYSMMDVIIVYETEAGRVTKWLPFADGAAADSWQIASIQADLFEPGLLNPGETAEILVELSVPALEGQTHRIVIVSDAGVVTSTPFTS